MDSKYEQLSKLKQLLDAGALTQEEFDAAKQRLLSTDDSHRDQQKHDDEVQNTSSAEISSKKWLYIVIAVIVVVIVVFILIFSGDKKDKDVASDEEWLPTEVVEETPYGMDDEAYPSGSEYDDDPSTLLLSVEDDEANKTSTQYGGWKKSYFRDEFNKFDYARPFMTLWVGRGAYNVNLGVLYRPSGSFTFKLFDDDGDVRDICGSTTDMTIRVKGQDIGPVTMSVIKNEWHITGEDTRVMSTIFNQGSFTISIKYDCYGVEDVHYVFNVKEAPGSFQRAVSHLLDSPYYGE